MSVGQISEWEESNKVTIKWQSPLGWFEGSVKFSKYGKSTSNCLGIRSPATGPFPQGNSVCGTCRTYAAIFQKRRGSRADEGRCACRKAALPSINGTELSPAISPRSWDIAAYILIARRIRRVFSSRSRFANKTVPARHDWTQRRGVSLKSLWQGRKYRKDRQSVQCLFTYLIVRDLTRRWKYI